MTLKQKSKKKKRPRAIRKCVVQKQLPGKQALYGDPLPKLPYNRCPVGDMKITN